MRISIQAPFLMVLALGFLGAAPAWPDSPGPADAAEVHEKKVGDVFFVEGSFEVPASNNLVWDVLSDYEHIGDFVSSIRKSVILERHQRTLILEQRATVRALFFSKEVGIRLEVHEIPGRTITFEDRSHSDFEDYQGTWNITDTALGSRVVYRLRAKPRMVAPSGMSAGILKSTSIELLNQVRVEIIRRLQHAGQTTKR